MAVPRKWKREFLFDNASSPQPSRRIGPQTGALDEAAPKRWATLQSPSSARCHRAIFIAVTWLICPAAKPWLERSVRSPATPMHCARLAPNCPVHAPVALGSGRSRSTAQGRIPGYGGRTDCGRGHLPTLRHDPDSFLNYPKWKREFAADNVAFGIAHLLTCAAVA